MAHIDQLNFIKTFVNYCKENFETKNFDILEIGSYDVNGTMKEISNIGRSYIGIDLIKGPSVDVVMNGGQINKLNKQFDIIYSCECFEHASNWKEIFSKMLEVSKIDSFIVISVASTGRIEHGTSRSGNWQSPGTHDEYYKNLSKNDFLKNFNIKKIFTNYYFFYNVNSFDLYFVGVKGFINKNIKFNELINDIKIKFKKKKVRKILFYLIALLINDKFRQDFFFARQRFYNFIRHIFHK